MSELLENCLFPPVQLGQLLLHTGGSEGVQRLSELGHEMVVHLIVGSQDLLQQHPGLSAYFIFLK